MPDTASHCLTLPHTPSTLQAVLPDGVVLSFLTFFHGTADHFHLSSALPGSDWRSRTSTNQKVRARLLHVDPGSKAVRLSLLPHLVNRAMPAPLPLLGQLLEDATVKRCVGWGVECMCVCGGGGRCVEAWCWCRCLCCHCM